MLKNVKKKIIYDDYKLVFHHDKLHNDSIIAKTFTITEVILNIATSKFNISSVV